MSERGELRDDAAPHPRGGLLVGGSAGTNVAAALRVAAWTDLVGPVVVVLPDSWDRYDGTAWTKALMEQEL